MHRLPLVLVVLACLAASAAAAEPAALTIEVDRPGVRVSPTLWGIFFEEINCSGDGGLYAELVRNRSFEDSDKPEHWSLATAGAAKAAIAVVPREPASEFNRRALRWTVERVDGGSAALVNGGWWGMALKRGEPVVLSLQLKAAGAAGPLVVALQSADGKQTYAEGKLEAPGAAWKTIALTLTPTATDPQARLVLTATVPGEIGLDMVSLFPQKTWKGHGLRPDLAEMLVGLRPAFVRFPGGCWVEGDKLEFASRWKRTIGPPADRWNQWNIWHYYSTNGLGYHEYLQMCEDLGAEPLFVINVGMSHKENVPMDQMGPWVQDALDAIEYANGPADSTWGAVRAQAGHPAPFDMKYIEIGNENGGPAYEERYALFYDAIRKRYPKMVLISDVPTRSRPSDVIDEHYYNSPEFFMQNAGKYDGYSRQGPKICVGEYAVTANAGQGHLRAALGEAAFMTGMERNSDHVTMASYAPLFVNVNYRRWNPNLINFDSSRAYGTPSYYVQKLFAEHRPDVALPVAVEAPPLPLDKPKSGAVGVGTWATQAEFKDLKVTKGGKVLFQSDFSQGLDGWKRHGGTWAVKDGAVQQTDSGDDIRLTAGDPAWTDYTYTLKARKLGGAEGFLVMFQVRGDGDWLWWNVGGWGNQRHGIERAEGGAKAPLGNAVGGSVETGRWYDLKVELAGPRVRCYLDGKRIHDASYSPIEPLYASAGRVEAGGEVIVKVVNTAAEPLAADVVLKGAKGLASQAAAIVLTSAKPTDENSLDEPTRVSPRTTTIAVGGPKFRHTFPANSFTVLRLKAQ